MGHFVRQAIIVSDTLSDRPGRYPDRAVLHCRNVGVTEPRAWPSMPHFLAGEGLMQSHVCSVGNRDHIKETTPLALKEKGAKCHQNQPIWAL